MAISMSLSAVSLPFTKEPKTKARGDFLEESDLDILLVTNRALSRKEKFEIYDLIFELEVKNNVVVSAVFATLSDLKAGKPPFSRQISKEGILLWSKE
jgi:predicted nucleotidyltransferase